MIDKRNTLNEKNTQTQRDRNTVADMDEVRADGDDDDEEGYSESDHGEDEDESGSRGDGTVSHSKRRQPRSFYFTTGVSKGNGVTQGVSQHFLKYHTDLNVRITALKVLPGATKNPRTL